MTSTQDPALHPDDDTLADRQEGLLPVDDTAAVDAHLAGCERCTNRMALLSGLPALLGEAAVTEAAPPDVVERIDRALAGERPAGSRTVLPSPLDRERTSFPMRLLQAAAVLVLLFAGVAVVAGPLTGGADEATVDAGSAPARDSAGETGGYPVSRSGQNWSPDTVQAGAADIVAGTLASTYAASGDAAQERASASTERLAAGPALADCVTALNDGPVTPLGVDLATWQGEPAAVIVLPAPGMPDEVEIWVVAPDCSQADAKVLYFAHATRP